MRSDCPTRSRSRFLGSDSAEFLELTPSDEGWFSYPELPLYWPESGWLPGQWEVRVAEFNVPALRFWQNVIEHYAGNQFKVEPWTRDDGARWNVFRFRSPISALLQPR